MLEGVLTGFCPVQVHGAGGTDAFARIAEELRGRVIAPPDLTERQLRRIVYV